MGHIKEPIGVDFLIKSDPMSNKEQAAISEFIRMYKIRYSKKKFAKPAKQKETTMPAKSLKKQTRIYVKK